MSRKMRLAGSDSSPPAAPSPPSPSSSMSSNAKSMRGKLRKALSGHLGLHRVTTMQKVLSFEEKRGDKSKDKYQRIARKFKHLEHSVTLEDTDDPDCENRKVEYAVYRTAIRSIIILILYFGVGLLTLSFLDKNIKSFDIFYFLVVTLTTIGYGDIYPSNKWSKLFVCLYTMLGLLMFSSALSALIRYWAQQQEKSYRKQILDRINEEEEEDDDDENHSENSEKGNDNQDDKAADSDDEDVEGQIHCENSVAMNEHKDIENNSKESNENVFPLKHAEVTTIYGMTDRLSQYFVEKMKIPPFAVPIIKDLLKSIVLLLLIIMLGTLCYYLLQENEKTNFVDAFYLTITTITTVGYGDVVPTNQESKWFTVVYACLGTLVTANCVMKFNQFISTYQTQHRQDIILRSEFSLKAFFDMDSDGNNEVSKEEFLLYKILHMNLVDAEIVARIERQFNAWDVDGSGSLTTRDIELMNERKIGKKERPRKNFINLSRLSSRKGGRGSANNLMGIDEIAEDRASSRSRSRSGSGGFAHTGSPVLAGRRYVPAPLSDYHSKVHPSNASASPPDGDANGVCSSNNNDNPTNIDNNQSNIVKVFDAT